MKPYHSRVIRGGAGNRRHHLFFERVVHAHFRTLVGGDVRLKRAPSFPAYLLDDFEIGRSRGPPFENILSEKHGR